ncbi:MAG: NAD-binding protein [Anaerolineales bacterium]|jgi:trk system potassium uptake protein TrkA
MNVIVVGCGRVGAELAFRLYNREHQVIVIDQIGAAFQNLQPEFRGRTVEGEALNRDVLLRAGIKQADGLAAVTNSDTLNAVIGHVARTEFQVPLVVVRNYDPSLRVMHEAFGFQIISSSSWGAQRIEELLHSTEFRTVYSAGNGEVEIYEFTVPTAWEGRMLEELLPTADCIPVALTRAGQAILPAGEFKLGKNDILSLSATLDGIKEMRRRLNAAKEV